MIVKRLADQVAFLRQQRPIRLVLERTLVGLDPGRFGEEEAVVRRDDDVVAVQVVDEVADQRRQFVDRPAHRREGLPFGLALIADGIDRVVVDVNDPPILHERSAFVFLLRHQFVVLAGQAADGVQDAVSFAGGAARLSVHPHLGSLVGQRPVRQQAGHAERGVGRQHAQLGTQFGFEAVLAVEFRGEFLGGFVAEGIADDDEGPPVLAFLQPRLHLAVVEAVLVGNLGDPPLSQQAAGWFDELAPGQGQVR